MVFPVLFYGHDIWTIKKTECWRIDAFQMWCWRTLKGPSDCKITSVNPKGNQPWIFIGRLILKLELLYFGHQCKELTHCNSPWCWERWEHEEKGATEVKMVRWHHQFNAHELKQLQEIVKNREACYDAVHGISKTILMNWTRRQFLFKLNTALYKSNFNDIL